MLLIVSLLLTCLTVTPMLYGGLCLAQGGGQVYFFSDFEGSGGGLVGTLDWEWGDYSWGGTGECCALVEPPPSAHSGTGLWGTALSGCYTGFENNQGADVCSNTDPSDDSILLFTVDLTGASSAYLSWWEWYDVFGGYDWAEVYVNDEVVFQHCGGTYAAPYAWRQRSINISSHAGGMATIEFHMMASEIVNLSGWYLDDIGVTSMSGNALVAPYLLLLLE